MATSLTNVLGSEINVGINGLEAQKTFTGFSGAHGIVSMNHGMRGYQVPINGRIRVTGTSYEAARNSANSAINAIADLQNDTEKDYSFKGTTYYDASFAGFKLIERNGKYYHWIKSKSQVVVDFQITLIGHSN